MRVALARDQLVRVGISRRRHSCIGNKFIINTVPQKCSSVMLLYYYLRSLERESCSKIHLMTYHDFVGQGYKSFHFRAEVGKHL